jgi:stress-induced morphogen
MVQQHRLVYAALGDRMGGEIHALALRTLTPGAWQGPAGT